MLLNKRVLLILLVVVCFASKAEAGSTFTVKAGGGGSFTTIQACVNAMASGDTCLVFSGTYNEVVTLSAGGVSNYKVVQANGTDVVNVFGFVMASHTKVIGNCTATPGIARIGTCGFNVKAPTPTANNCFSSANGTTDYYIVNNDASSCGAGGYMLRTRTGSSGAGSTFVFIQGNTFAYGCSTAAAPNICKGLAIVGDHILVENNDISHVEDGMTLFANHSVVRNNVTHDQLESECGTNTSNCHRDAIESEPTTSTDPASAFNLYEGNTVLRNIGNNAHVYLLQGDGCTVGSCTHAIIRYNSAAHVGTDSSGRGGTGILDDNAGSGSACSGYTFVKTYNNTTAFLQDVTNGSHDFYSNGSCNGSEINNIHFLGISATSYDVFAAYNGGQTGFVAKGNLAYCAATPCTFSANYTGAYGTGNITGNPLFVNTALDNYLLQIGSPAIGAGTFLTASVGAGSSSTSLTVADAAFFQDGYGGIPGVQADTIRIGALVTSPIVQISSINYSTNVITLATPVTWSNNAPIFLYKDSRGNVVLNGANPDIGAYQSGGTSTSLVPSGLQASVN